jgi:phosphate/sulfate permease
MEKKDKLNTNSSPADEVKFYFFTFFIALVIIIGYKFGMDSYYLGWIAFTVAAFSVAGNDAIQTIGTFIESKKGGILLPKVIIFCGLLYIVHLYGWSIDDREIHFHRLDKFEPPKAYNLIQLLAPIVLVIITRLKAPISTTFLILGLFGGQNIEKMLTKSFLGYGIAFSSALIIWGTLSVVFKKDYDDTESEEDSGTFWQTAQWFSTSFLWVAWLLQDTANIAVFLPRKLSFIEVIVALFIISLALTLIIKTNGGKIQEVVSEKTDLKSAKAATIVDLVYASILLIFQKWSNIPMSTTWVFLGMLAGREVILHIMTSKDRPYLDTFRQVGKDVVLASLGIAISIFIFILSSLLYTKEAGVLKFIPNPVVEYFHPSLSLDGAK